MALVLRNRVQETTTTTGTGSLSLGGAATGYQTFSSALSNADTTYYQVTDGTDWEIGLGTYDSSADQLARTTVFESSNSDNKVNWGAGSKDVFIVMPAEAVHSASAYSAILDLPVVGNTVGAQAVVTANNSLYIWTASGWFKIATINQTPTVTGNSASYKLAIDGTPTVITLSVTDLEGFPLTWSH